MIDRKRTLERRATAMTVAVVLLFLVTTFFLLDVAGDVREGGWRPHLAIEGLAAVGLLLGVLFGALQVRWLIMRARQDEAAVATARGAMTELIKLRFADWQLTAAEADVALFALKGCDIAEIAGLRSVAEGTVRAQLARVYAKAGVRSQVALMALFVDELVEVVR